LTNATAEEDSKKTPVHEYLVYGPKDLHDIAIKAFLESKKINPDDKLDYDGPFMTRARKHAESRLIIKPEEEIRLRRPMEEVTEAGEAIGGNTNKLLNLPSPMDGRDSVLLSAVNSQTSSFELVVQEDANAMAIAFNEDVGLGAISKAGALPMGANGEWIEYAEEKLKKENGMDYQSLLAEIGAEVAEKRAIDQGGYNITHEKLLLENMKQWFIKGGGKLNFVEPEVTPEGFKLVATEDVQHGEPILSVPMKLIMCPQTARNVLVYKKGKYLGEELQKTFEKNEIWGLAIFLLHEYYKEVSGVGSKWGPFIKTLRMRQLTTEAIQALKGTIAGELFKKWHKSTESFMWWTTGADGPCSPSSGICKMQPGEIRGESRFDIHQIRWAYWVVKQNIVKVRHATTGYEFFALIPYYGMLEKKLNKGGGISFDFDGSINIRLGGSIEEGTYAGLHPGNFTDSEFFLRFFSTPNVFNPWTEMKLSLPGTIPKGSKFHYCIKGTDRQMNSDECKGGYRSEKMFWTSKVLGEWRSQMNLPPRLQEIRMWATRLHLYGDREEMKLLSAANQMIAGLPIPVEEMPAEEQLMLLGIAKDNEHAALMLYGPTAERYPQLYAAPDPDEDPEARRAMEHLAHFAAQAQNVISTGNLQLNATRIVLNHTRNFFQHGVLPMAGLDELDEFLLKKIGMLSHCGFENDMKITQRNITNELFCAMRVHLMNDTEVEVFCPAEARVWQDNCLDVQFLNYTAISVNNELNVVTALRNSIHGLMNSYPTSMEEDKGYLDANTDPDMVGNIMLNAVLLRYREKELLMGALDFLNDHEVLTRNGSIPFQLELKAQERIEATIREEEHKLFIEAVRKRAEERLSLASIEVDMGSDRPKVNLTLEEGNDIRDTVLAFCKKHNVGNNFADKLISALKPRVVSPKPLLLMLGVVVPSGDRMVLGIPEGSNVTVEVGVFCAKYEITPRKACEAVEQKVQNRLNVTFVRRILTAIPIDSPDTRKLQLVIREGEQHDLFQFVGDFLQFYKLPQGNVEAVANEVHKRLPPIAMNIPINMGTQRTIQIRLSTNDNITNVVEAACNIFDFDENAKLAITKRARFGMAPGSFMV